MEKGSKMLKVICTSTGGRPLTMSITGPSGVVENMTKIVTIVTELLTMPGVYLIQPLLVTVSET